MSIRRKPDLIAGLVLAVTGGFVIHEALDLSYRSEFGPGPGFFPLWVGAGMLVCSLFMVLSSFTSDDAGEPAGALSLRALGSWGAFVVALAVLPLLGFPATLALLTGFLVWILDRRSPWTAAAVGAALAAGFHVVFTRALGVALPAGPFGF
jgi:putative tricarboxylic transport membrane protein